MGTHRAPSRRSPGGSTAAASSSSRAEPTRVMRPRSPTSSASGLRAEHGRLPSLHRVFKEFSQACSRPVPPSGPRRPAAPQGVNVEIDAILSALVHFIPSPRRGEGSGGESYEPTSHRPHPPLLHAGGRDRGQAGLPKSSARCVKASWRRATSSGQAKLDVTVINSCHLSPTSLVQGPEKAPCPPTRSSATVSLGSWPTASSRISGPGAPSSRARPRPRWAAATWPCCWGRSWSRAADSCRPCTPTAQPRAAATA
jgi:hypothetical protein